MSKMTRRTFLKIFASFTIILESLFSKGRTKNKKRIALCIGHNSRSKGALGNNNVFEYDFNKKIIEDVLNHVNKKNTYKIFYRPASRSYAYEQDVMRKEIKQWGNVDYAIEFHFNACDDKSVDGHEVLYLSKQGRDLGLKLKDKFNIYLLNDDRGVKRTTKRGYGFLRRGRYPSIIAEPFFASKTSNYEKGLHRDRLITAYAEFLEEL